MEASDYGQPQNGFGITIMSRHLYSLAAMGTALLTERPLIVAMGGITIDLISAPIAPGIYRLSLSAVMGGIELFLPRYATYYLHGTAFWGGRRTVSGQTAWSHIRQRLGGHIDLGDQPPPFAIEPQRRSVIMHCSINAVMGGAVVYQL